MDPNMNGPGPGPENIPRRPPLSATAPPAMEAPVTKPSSFLQMTGNMEAYFKSHFFFIIMFVGIMCILLFIILHLTTLYFTCKRKSEEEDCNDNCKKECKKKKKRKSKHKHNHSHDEDKNCHNESTQLLSSTVPSLQDSFQPELLPVPQYIQTVPQQPQLVQNPSHFTLQPTQQPSFYNAPQPMYQAPSGTFYMTSQPGLPGNYYSTPQPVPHMPSYTSPEAPPVISSTFHASLPERIVSPTPTPPPPPPLPPPLPPPIPKMAEAKSYGPPGPPRSNHEEALMAAINKRRLKVSSSTMVNNNSIYTSHLPSQTKGDSRKSNVRSRRSKFISFEHLKDSTGLQMSKPKARSSSCINNNSTYVQEEMPLRLLPTRILK